MYIFETSIFGIHIAPTWYGLMYALGFIFCYYFGSRYSQVARKDLDNILLYIFLGVILWGRLGYIILYNPLFFIEHPIEIFSIWKWGMSFHGGFLWVLFAVFLFARKYRYRFFEITDILAVCIPIALGLGRIGNWINWELPWYSPYDGPFAMMISGVGHFPNPLLEMCLEWVILFIVLFSFWKLKRLWVLNFELWTLSALFLIGYSIARLIAEQFRLPDAHIGYLFGTDWITLGILYTIPMMIVGFWILLHKIPKQ
jgi:phosphatidylglycerol:prolipoprotein diacylglycerol transferase